MSKGWSDLAGAWVATVLIVGAGCAARVAPATAPGGTAAATAAAIDVGLRDVFGAVPDDLTTWSVLFAWADTGEVIYARDPDRRLTPASNMKIITLAAAAQQLGWDHQFATTVWSEVPPVDGVVRGPLLVRGSGDPTVGWPTEAARLAMRGWARALRDQGVTRVEGDLVGDPDAHGADRLGESWGWDDLSYGYAAPYAGLTFHENTAALIVSPAATAGEPAQVRLEPSASGLQLVADVTTTDAPTATRISIERGLGSTVLRVKGEVIVGAAAAIRYVAVPDPARFFLESLRQALAVEGIDVRGETRVRPLAPLANGEAGGVHFVHRSPPLAEIAVRFMKVSQNLYGEALLHAIAPQRDASLTARRERVSAALTALGVPTGDLLVADGSGLSRRNFVSARTLVALLRALDTPAHQEAFRNTLPIAGVDGTLERRMVGTACQERVRAKTGSLSHARALSGYLTTGTGREIVFSVLANNHLRPTGDVDAVVDAALVTLCR